MPPLPPPRPPRRGSPGGARGLTADLPRRRVLCASAALAAAALRS
eukprot:gene54191-44604_t